MYFTSIPSFILLTRVGPEILKQPIFFLYVDPVTLIRVRGQQQKYQCVEFHGGYNHTKFDYARYHSMRDNPNVKFASTSGQPRWQCKIKTKEQADKNHGRTLIIR